MSRSTLGTLAVLAVGLVLAGALVAAVLPGGPVDLAGLGDGPAGPATAEPHVTAEPTATPPPGEPTGTSPWGKEVLVVAVENRAAPERNVTAAVGDALAYWNEHRGYADYPARFVLRPAAAEPDLVLHYEETIDCPDHADAIGCAPVLQPGTRADPPVSVGLRYDPADNRRQVRNTAIHELGHVLGLTHCEEPYWIMAPACAESVPDAPDADARDLAFREANLTIHVDYGNVSPDERAATEEQVGHALAYLEDDPDDELPADVSLVRVDDRFEADLTVSFSAGRDCPEDAAVCFVRRGRDYDGDGRLEYYTNGRVRVRTVVDVEARGWFVGRSLAVLISPGNVPSVFEDAGYRERRGEWWR